MMGRGLRNSIGFTLIETMIAMGLVSVIALAVFTLQNYMNEGKVKSTNAYIADQFRKEIMAYLTNPTAWKYTLNNNNTFSCVINASNCYDATFNGPPAYNYSISTMTPDSTSTTTCSATATSCSGGFDVYSYTQTIVGGVATTTPVDVYPDASIPTEGFRLNGSPCGPGTTPPTTGWSGVQSGNMSVGGTSASSLCPFRLVLWWVPICPTTTGSGTCYSPEINVKGYLLYTPNPTDPYGTAAPNPMEFGVNVILPPKYY